MYYSQKNITKSDKINKFKVSLPKWNEKLELPDELYSVLDIQDYFVYILKENTEKRVKILKYNWK